ncbi:hypothetical protein V6N13_051672 [Hibiscus sabdariffa]
MSDGSGNWRWSLFSHLLPENVLLHIAAVKGPLVSSSHDRVGWRGTSDLSFSIKSASELRTRQPTSGVHGLWTVLHKFRGLPRIKAFLWLVCWEKLMTNVERVRRRFSTEASCFVCGAAFEDVDHVFRKCPAAVLVWRGLIARAKHVEFFKMELKDWTLRNFLMWIILEVVRRIGISCLRQFCGIFGSIAMLRFLVHHVWTTVRFLVVAFSLCIVRSRHLGIGW